MVRQPIPLWLRVGLGILSVLLLIGSYWLLAHQRQQARRNEAYGKLVHVRQQLADLEGQQKRMTPGERETAPRDAGQTAERIREMRAQAVLLERESIAAVDRTVPTFRSLYRDGLRRVLTPQGLRQDEYWLWEDAIATAERLVAGLLVGVLLSVVLGILMGAYSPVEAFFVPPLSFLAKIPPTAMLAVFFVLVGVNFRMYVTMIAFGTLPTLAQTVYQAAKKDVPESLVFKAYTLGASHMELIWNVIYKQILPRLIDAVRLQIGPAMVLLVAAEWMVAGEGFGYRLRLFYQRTDMTVVYVYLFLLGIVGLLVDYALIWFRRLLCPWFGE
jgi:NitT/TauT family transport system permease protein